MTDQRARALIARYDLVDVTRCGEGWREMQRDDQYGDWVSYEDHIAALADAERGGMVRAAKILDEYACFCDTKALTVKVETVRALADRLRTDAQAHAGQAG